MSAVTPELVPGAFIRPYVGDAGRSWIVIYGVPARRHRLDMLERIIVEGADGHRDLPALADLAEGLMRQKISVQSVADRVAGLRMLGILTSGERTTLHGAVIGNLVSRHLEPAAAAKLQLRIAPGARTGCDGRGG